MLADARNPGAKGRLQGVSPVLDEVQFRHFQQMIMQVAGIHMPPAKRTMVAGRLAKRLTVLELDGYAAYWAHICRDPDEKQLAVDLLTTNETYFFREEKHFEFLASRILPACRRGRPFRIWSAACSSGEEPYSLAMVLADVLGGSDWRITASDISTQVLERARSGQYPMARAEKISRERLKRHCLRGVGPREGTFMVSPALRERVDFRQINLNVNLPNIGMFDMIFLRNVMIYFNAETKQQIVERVLSRLNPGGHFIIGHSETLNGLQSGTQAVLPSIYRKPE